MTSLRLAPHLLLCGLAACFSDPGAGSPTSATESTGGSAFSSDGDTVATTGSTSSPDPSTSTSSSTGDDTTSTTSEDTTSTTELGSTTGGVCGDGVVDPGEECDDGPANADDAPCSSACVSAFCGDGVVQPALDEECDDGPANADNAACTEACEAAKCGDGLIWEGVEECDNEDDNKIGGYGDCTPGDCTWWGDHCGDGVVQKEHEECDLGAEDNEADGNACTKSCKLDGKAMFVTSKSYTGKLGGLSGADDRCNSLALAAGVANAGEFMAWLSTEEESPASRMTHSTQRYDRRRVLDEAHGRSARCVDRRRRDGRSRRQRRCLDRHHARGSGHVIPLPRLDKRRRGGRRDSWPRQGERPRLDREGRQELRLAHSADLRRAVGARTEPPDEAGRRRGR